MCDSLRCRAVKLKRETKKERSAAPLLRWASTLYVEIQENQRQEGRVDTGGAFLCSSLGAGYVVGEGEGSGVVPDTVYCTAQIVVLVG